MDSAGNIKDVLAGTGWLKDNNGVKSVPAWLNSVARTSWSELFLRELALKIKRVNFFFFFGGGQPLFQLIPLNSLLSTEYFLGVQFKPFLVYVFFWLFFFWGQPSRVGKQSQVLAVSFYFPSGNPNHKHLVLEVRENCWDFEVKCQVGATSCIWLTSQR